MVLQVVSSTALLTGNRASINGSTDSAQVVVDGRSAAMDVSLTMTPTTVYNQGRLEGTPTALHGTQGCDVAEALLLVADTVAVV